VHPSLLLREFNLWEAVFWFLVGTAVLLRPAAIGLTRKERCLVVVALFAFGISDLVEMKTGAWWKPWWFLAWKASCALTFVALSVNHLKARKRDVR